MLQANGSAKVASSHSPVHGDTDFIQVFTKIDEPFSAIATDRTANAYFGRNPISFLESVNLFAHIDNFTGNFMSQDVIFAPVQIRFVENPQIASADANRFYLD
jgi:hypothetical protein